MTEVAQPDAELEIGLHGNRKTVVSHGSGRTSEVTRSERDMRWMRPGERLGRLARPGLACATGFRDPLLAAMRMGIAQELLAPTPAGALLVGAF